VTSDAGGIPYIIKHEVTGLLVPRDDPSALANAALRYLEEPGLAARITKAARSTVVERYTWSVAEREWLTVYRNVRDRKAIK
jgi:glycosyltransferase involved in cell wall biosynthesis